MHERKECDWLEDVSAWNKAGTAENVFRSEVYATIRACSIQRLVVIFVKEPGQDSTSCLRFIQDFS